MTGALDQLLLDIFTTALEGGIGYWSSCQEYHWMLQGDYKGLYHSPVRPGVLAAEPDYKGFYALIAEEDGDEQKPHTIDRSVIAKGYRLATTDWKHRIAWSTSDPPLVVGPDTDWDFDAGDADAIVQLGLFGEVVYG